MNRVNIKEQVFNFVFLLLLQLPLIHRLTLFNKAFGFFYIGFILLLPVSLSRSYLMIIGFVSGLLVDIISSTPGIHASSCVLVMFVRNMWLSVIDDDWKEFTNLNQSTLQPLSFAAYLFPLIFIHHLCLFIVEAGGFHLFGQSLVKVLLSTIFSGTIVVLVNVIISGNRRRT